MQVDAFGQEWAKIKIHAALVGFLPQVLGDDHIFDDITERGAAISGPVFEAGMCAPDDGARTRGIQVHAPGDHCLIKGVTGECRL